MEGTKDPEDTEESKKTKRPEILRLPFSQTLNENEAMSVINLLNDHRPNKPAVKKQKKKEAAAALASGED